MSQRKRDLTSSLPTGLLSSVVLAAVLGGVFEPQPAKSAEPRVAVIVNAANDCSSISLARLRLMYLRKQTRWAQTDGALSGKNIVPLDLPAGTKARERFATNVLDRTVQQMTEFWIREKLKGGASPPLVRRTTADVVGIVGKLPGAVGYVPADAVLDASVKVVAKF